MLAPCLAVVAGSSLGGATPPADGTYTGVLDRFEATDDGRLAVLLLEAAGDPRARLVAPAEALPERARHQDAVLAVTVRDGDLSRARYLPEETRGRAEAAQARFDRLAQGDCGDD